MFSFLRQFSNFRNYWLGQVVSQLGDRIHTLAVIWLIYEWTRSGTMLGLVLVASALPALLLAPVAGFVSDRFDRKAVLIIADLVRALLALLLAALAATGQLGIASLVIITALISLVSGFFNPAALAMLPTIVPAGQLSRGNAITQLSANASGAVGFLAGSGLIALIGVPVAFLFNGLSFVVSVLFIKQVQHSQPEGSLTVGFLSNLAQGWASVKAIPMAYRLVLPLVLINLFYSALTVLIPIFGEGVFAAGSAGIGILMASYTGGMFLSALVLSNWRPRQSVGWIVVISLALQACCFILMGLFGNLPLFAVLLVFTGFALSLVNISLISLLQSVVPREVQGRFFSLLTAASLSTQPISYGLAGWLADVTGPSLLIILCGCALCVGALMMYRIEDLRSHYL